MLLVSFVFRLHIIFIILVTESSHDFMSMIVHGLLWPDPIHFVKGPQIENIEGSWIFMEHSFQMWRR